MTPVEWRRSFLARVLAQPERSLETFKAALVREGAQALTPVVCPVVIDGATRSHFERLVRAWHQGMHEALRAWANDPTESIVFPPGLESRVRDDARQARALGSTRYDFIVDAAGAATLIECQAGDPSGMGVEEASAAAFASLDAFDATGLHRTSIASSFRQFVAPSPAASGLVVFVIHREAFLEWDVARLLTVFRAEGVDAIMVDPAELRFADGRLWVGARVVKTVVRDSLEDLLAPERVAASHALMEAWAAVAVEVINPMGSIAADHKVLLGRLRSTSVLECLPDETSALLRQTVPETVALESVRAPSRQEWVLKPSDGFGGFDVTIGPAVTDDEWLRAVTAAGSSGRTFLLQSFVRAERAEFPVVVDGRLELRPHHLVLSGWMHGDRFGGLFARVHQRAVVNVHQGGGLVPVYTLAS
ncbi:MAG: hypothetical protein Q8L14_40615 [Myxococcales bacterium]|nr:hypothetical protein [Myxococcales bacterium]